MKMAFDLRLCARAEVLPLFEQFHGYKSVGRSTTYCLAVFEDRKPVAAYVWQPPPPGAAKAVCPEAPHGVLSLSRMVAVPRDQRALQHISKPLRKMMKHVIDRTRWPVLVTYSDEGQGHTGHVYKCSGWQPTVRCRRPIKVDAEGCRVSVYRNGVSVGGATGHTWLQRWEHRICAVGRADYWMALHGWIRKQVPGKTWKNGRPAFTYIKVDLAA